MTSRSGNPLGRFTQVIKEYQTLEIVDYQESSRTEMGEDFRGLTCVVGSAKPVDNPAKVVDVDAFHQMGSDGWIKVWPVEDDPRIPDNKLWLYQPRAKLIDEAL